MIRGPNRQLYELGASQPEAVDNHVIYVWTDDNALDATAAAYCRHFGLQDAGDQSFHDTGRVRLLRRARPGVTIGLLHAPVQPLAAREAFAPAGDVAFVYFADSYLELVQA